MSAERNIIIEPFKYFTERLLYKGLKLLEVTKTLLTDGWWHHQCASIGLLVVFDVLYFVLLVFIWVWWKVILVNPMDNVNLGFQEQKNPEKLSKR